MQTWANGTDVRVGTRSYDAWKTFKRGATKGIVESATAPEEARLQDALYRINPDFSFETKEIQNQFPETVRRHLMSIEDLQVDNWRDIRGELEKFIHYACAYNCIKDKKKQSLQNEAATHWTRLHVFLEDAALNLLALSLGLDPGGDKSTVANRLKEVAPEKYGDPQKRQLEGILKPFVDFYRAENMEGGDFVRYVKRHIQSVSPVRNNAVHGGGAGALARALTVAGTDWKSQLKTFNSRLEVMCTLITMFAAETEKLSDKPSR